MPSSRISGVWKRGRQGRFLSDDGYITELSIGDCSTMIERDLGIDKFKERTLQRLQDRGEGRRTYPIGSSDLLRVTACVLCGSRSIIPLTEVYLPQGLNFFSTSVCQACLYTFRSVSPAYAWFKRCWETISEKRREVFNPSLEEIRRARYEKYFDLLGSHAREGLVLDLGAGYGTGAKVFRDHGCRVEATEAEDDKAFYIRECLNIPLHETPIEAFVEEPRSYRLVLFSHCLEHLDNPVRVLSRVGNLLEPARGLLYLEVPVLWECVNWSDALYLTHKSNFTEENVEDLAERCGFKVLERVRYRASDEEPLDVGLVLEPVAGRRREFGDFRKTEGKDVDDVRTLYRKKLPLSEPPPLETVLRYQVPYVEHFYQTLRLDSKQLRQADHDPGNITIHSVDGQGIA
jgi:SAM-dependent methyltransferase